MKHKMKLNDGPFNLINNGSKTIELRLNDEKRQLLKENDIIYFKNILTQEIIKVRVIKLYQYDSFKELYKYIDKVSLGYKKEDKISYKDMEKYYSKEKGKKYGVVAIKFELLNRDKKKIINNCDNLTMDKINRIIRRAKLLIETSNNKIAICYCNNNYFLLGGHVDNDESDMQCLHRELLEESGIDIDFNDLDPFITIKYLNKDYPEEEINTLSIANYYSLIYDIKCDLKNIDLTEDKINGGFKIVFIDKDKIINILEKSLDKASRKGVTLDTIQVIKEYLK